MRPGSYPSWIGGKKLLRRQIIEQFPEEYDRYIEVFGGAGWVLFAEDRAGKMEVYNDVNGRLVEILERSRRFVRTENHDLLL